MSRQLPPRPDLDQLKKQARELLKAHQAASPSAVTAIKEHFPRLSGSSDAEICRAEYRDVRRSGEALRSRDPDHPAGSRQG